MWFLRFPLISLGCQVAETKICILLIPFLIIYQSCFWQGTGDLSGVRWDTKGFCLHVLHGLFYLFDERSCMPKWKKQSHQNISPSSITDSVSDLFSPLVVLMSGDRIARNLKRKVLRKLNQVGVIRFPKHGVKCLFKNSREVIPDIQKLCISCQGHQVLSVTFLTPPGCLEDVMPVSATCGLTSYKDIEL
jgi:hypothetical protein